MLYTNKILNRIYNAPLIQNHCNSKAQETGRPLYCPFPYYLQDKSLILRIRPTYKSSSLSCISGVSSKAFSFIIGGTMAFGNQHSSTMPIEANLKTDDQKVQKRSWN